MSSLSSYSEELARLHRAVAPSAHTQALKQARGAKALHQTLVFGYVFELHHVEDRRTLALSFTVLALESWVWSPGSGVLVLES